MIVSEDGSSMEKRSELVAMLAYVKEDFIIKRFTEIVWEWEGVLLKRSSLDLMMSQLELLVT